MQNSVQHPWMIYGAYGFTGRLIVEAALQRGHRPILAGRDGDRVKAMAEQLGLTAMPISLDDGDALRAALRAVPLVLNASGPFTETGLPIIEACLDTGTSYADISGEFHHLRTVTALNERARQADIALLSGAGFGVTLGDCLARHVADQLPDATHLRISVAAANAQSTSAVRRTILNVVSNGGYAVERGQWRRRSIAHKSWLLKHDGKPVPFAAAPMGELVAAFNSTRIANIVVGRPMSATAARGIRTLSPLIKGVLSVGPVRRALGNGSGTTPTKPEPAGYHSWLAAEAQNARGERRTAFIEAGEGYAVTADAAVTNVEALLAQKLAGAFTPSTAFGAAHVLKVSGVRLVDVDPKTVSLLPLRVKKGSCRHTRWNAHHAQASL